jgi:hypothetical protein
MNHMSGEVAERLKAQHWKCCLGQLNEGSNPSLSVEYSWPAQEKTALDTGFRK